MTTSAVRARLPFGCAIVRGTVEEGHLLDDAVEVAPRRDALADLFLAGVPEDDVVDSVTSSLGAFVGEPSR